MTDNEVVAGVVRYLFDPCEGQDDEFTMELVNNGADGTGLLFAKTGGDAIAAVPEFCGGFRDADPRFYVYAGMILQAAAYGGSRNTQ